MKKILTIGLLAMALSGSGIVTSCNNKTKDSDIQASFNDKARTDASLANVSATVNEGVVTLSGNCPDQNCSVQAENTAKGIKGVKSVVNNITVGSNAPVVIANDASLKNSVDAVVAKYPGVTADISGGIVTLRGNIKRDDMQRLMPEIHATNPKKVENQLTVQ